MQHAMNCRTEFSLIPGAGVAVAKSSIPQCRLIVVTCVETRKVSEPSIERVQNGQMAENMRQRCVCVAWRNRTIAHLHPSMNDAPRPAHVLINALQSIEGANVGFAKSRSKCNPVPYCFGEREICIADDLSTPTLLLLRFHLCTHKKCEPRLDGSVTHAASITLCDRHARLRHL